MDLIIIIVLAFAAVTTTLAALALFRSSKQETSKIIARNTDRLAAQQAELAGRLTQIAEADAASQKALSERLQNQELAMH